MLANKEAARVRLPWLLLVSVLAVMMATEQGAAGLAEAAPNATPASGPAKKDGALDRQQQPKQQQQQQLLAAGQLHESSLPVLAPGEEKTVILKGDGNEDLLFDDPNATTSTKLVEKTLPDGRKLVYEIVDEIVDDDDDDDADDDYEDETGAGKVSTELPSAITSASAPAATKGSGNENNNNNNNGPNGEEEKKKPDTKADDRPESNNNPDEEKQQQQPQQQQQQQKQEQKPSEQQQLASAPIQPTKPTGAQTAQADPDPAPALKHTVQPAPAAAALNQHIEQQQHQHNNEPQQTPEAPSAAPAPNNTHAGNIADEPKREASRQQQPNVRIKGVGNKSKKLVDNSVVNLETRDGPAEIVIEDSGNETEDIELNRKLNKLERNKKPEGRKSKKKQPDDDDDNEEESDDKANPSSDVPEEDKPNKSKHQRKHDRSKKSRMSKKDKKNKRKANKTSVDDPKSTVAGDKPEAADVDQDQNSGTDQQPLATPGATGEAAAPDTAATAEPDDDDTDDVDQTDVQDSKKVPLRDGASVVANSESTSEKVPIQPASTGSPQVAPSGAQPVGVQGSSNQAMQLELNKNPQLNSIVPGQQTNTQVIPANELTFGHNLPINGQTTVIPSAGIHTNIQQPQQSNIQLQPNQHSSTTTVLPGQPQQQTTIVPGQQSSTQVVTQPELANQQTIIHQQPGAQETVVQPGVQTETIVQPGVQTETIVQPGVQTSETIVQPSQQQQTVLTRDPQQPVVIEERVDTVEDGDDPEEDDDEMMELDETEEIDQGQPRGRWRRRRIRGGRRYGRRRAGRGRRGGRG